MRTIVHSCSSVLIRPNGIVRYINSVIDLQKKLGHYVVFVTDSKPTQQINADKIVYVNDDSSYVPNWKDGHVWLQVSNQTSTQINKAFGNFKRELEFSNPYARIDMIIAHDIHSYLGLKSFTNDGIFIQHESDVLSQDSRYSFLSDEYLAQQIDIVNTTSWRVGLTIPSEYIKPKRPIYTPVPFSPVNSDATIKTRDLLYIGDSTDRKGAKEFMDVARRLGVRPTVITHDINEELFRDADVFTFTLDQRQEMFDLMKQCRVAYIPSRNECPGIAILECLQFMPVVVNGNYNWTKSLDDLGVIRSNTVEHTHNVLTMLLVDESYNRMLLDIWSKNGIQFWINLST